MTWNPMQGARELSTWTEDWTPPADAACAKRLVREGPAREQAFMRFLDRELKGVTTTEERQLILGMLRDPTTTLERIG